MRLKYLGANLSDSAVDALNAMYNCSKSQCQKEYMVFMPEPLDQFWFADLNEIQETERYFRNDDTYELDLGDAAGVQFYWGFGGATGAASMADGVFGFDWDDKPFAVFTGLQTTGSGSCFGIMALIIIGDRAHWFIGEQMTTAEPCPRAWQIEACYPNPVGEEVARDSNGTYYGYTSRPGDSIGNLTLRYQHIVRLRRADIYGTKDTMNISYHNSLRAFRSSVKKEFKFTTEIMPEFMKDEVGAAFFRGNVAIIDYKLEKRTVYRVSETVDWQIVDEDAKLWRVDTGLVMQLTAPFNCSGTCGDPSEGLVCAIVSVTNITFTFADGIWTMHVTLSGTLNNGDGMNFVITPVGGGDAIASEMVCEDDGGCSGTLDIELGPIESFTPDEICYDIEYTRVCAASGVSPYNSDSATIRRGTQCNNLTSRSLTDCYTIVDTNIASGGMQAAANPNGGDVLDNHGAFSGTAEWDITGITEDCTGCLRITVNGSGIANIPLTVSGTYELEDFVITETDYVVVTVLEECPDDTPGVFRVDQNMPGVTITNVENVEGFTFDTGNPITPGGGDFQEGAHDDSGLLGIKVTTTGTPVFNPSNIVLLINNIVVQCINVSGAGAYTFAVHPYTQFDDVRVSGGLGACP